MKEQPEQEEEKVVVEVEEDAVVESEPEEIVSPEPEVPAETIEIVQPEAQPDPV